MLNDIPKLLITCTSNSLSVHFSSCVIIRLPLNFCLFTELREFLCNRMVLLFEQKSSDLAVSSENEEVKRGFTSAVMLPLGQGLLCATADQQFLIYDLDKHADESLNVTLRKRLIGYNEEIADMKFLGDEEQFLAVATTVEQVSYLKS